jgi:23S rRNA (cytidine1920-2'-O)/16S rRNA (cytidine1409-2'-O)-methyltransferase
VRRRRLDLELVRRGLAGSPGEAREAILRGGVLVRGRPAPKPETLVDPGEAISLAGQTRPYVSRGGEKLAAALDRFGIDPAGRECLDAGASTGGFTDALLARGAARVTAVDVGYGQLAWALREDPRVTVMERTNVRDLEPDRLTRRSDLVVADLSFISLTKVLPALSRVSADDAEFVLLVKPQFEADPAEVGRGGVVRDPEVWRRAIREVAEAGERQGLGPQAVIPSPLPGPAGNVEFLLYAVRGRPGRVLDLDEALVAGRVVRESA